MIGDIGPVEIGERRGKGASPLAAHGLPWQGKKQGGEGGALPEMVVQEGMAGGAGFRQPQRTQNAGNEEAKMKEKGRWLQR